MPASGRDERKPVKLELREITDADLRAIVAYEREPSARYMAAFIRPEATEEECLQRWSRILQDPTTTNKVIVWDGQVVGHIASFTRDGKREVTYWIATRHWGRGIASRALTEFLRVVTDRPLHARVAADNIASLRVLEKCGFQKYATERGFAQARDAEIEEILLKIE